MGLTASQICIYINWNIGNSVLTRGTIIVKQTNRQKGEAGTRKFLDMIQKKVRKHSIVQNMAYFTLIYIQQGKTYVKTCEAWK